MVRSWLIWLVMMVITSMHSNSQSPARSGRIWNVRAISGEVDLKGQYRQLESNFNDVYEDQRSSYVMGSLKLNTSSYLWNPDIILLDIGGAYSPETRDEKYISIPDRSEVRTLKKINLMTTLLNNKPISFQAFFNFDQNYFNRELLTNVRSNNMQWGGILSLNNKFLPVNVTYRKINWDQEEIQTGRIFQMDQENLQIRASKSFGSRDRSELVYSHNDYLYSYAQLHRTNNLIDRVAINNNIYLDESRNYNLNSRFTWYDQQGTTSFRRIEVLEGLTFKLPHNLRATANFDLYNLKDPVQIWDQKRGRATIRHKLFESLTSKMFFEYARVNQEASTVHAESDARGGVDLNYSKKIPTGHLNLSYRYYRHHHTTEGISGLLQILNEEQTITDGEVTLLNKPYADVTTVIVKDETGALIYQVNFDYILIDRSGYVEIQRVPGGQIPDNGTVYIDYSFRQPGSYSYGANNNYLNTSILLFGRLIEVYYRYAVQDYPKLTQGELLTLNYFTQHVYGIRLDLGFARGGVESDIYNSTIIPYRMRRYYMDLNWNYRSKLLLNINGNIRDYTMIADEVDQLYANISGKAAYTIRPRMRVSLETGYLSQRGINIDLDLITSRAEFHSAFQKFHVRVGVEMYRRLYQNSEFAFNGTYVRFTRNF